MKKNLAILSGSIALALVLTPVAFAARSVAAPKAAMDIEQTNAAPSVQQQGVKLDDTAVTVTADSGETTTVKTEVVTTDEAVAIQNVEVFIAGQTDVTASVSDAISEAQEEADAAIAAANETGSTVQSMADTNQAVTETLAAAGATTENTFVTQEFYLGIQDPTAGKTYNGQVNAVITMPSTEEAAAVVAVFMYDATTGQWIPVPFTMINGKIVIQSSKNATYRFVSKIG